MKWAKLQLLKFRNKPLELNETLDLKELIAQRFSDIILDIDQVFVTGKISILKNDDIEIQANVKTCVTAPSSRSLEPVKINLDFDINELYISNLEDLKKYEEENQVFFLEKDIIDLDEIVVENIISEMPLQILTDEEQKADNMPKGDEWRVISYDDLLTEEKSKEEDFVDPRWDALNDLKL